MGNIVTGRQRKPYANTARKLREGAEIVSIAPRLRLIQGGVQDAPADSYPRLGVPLTREQRAANMADEGFTPDEIASVTFAMGGAFEPVTILAHDATPWDLGPEAA